MRKNRKNNNLVEISLVVGVMLILWQLLSQGPQIAAVMPYIALSLLSILTLMVKSRFK
jgi:hypothetical protein